MVPFTSTVWAVLVKMALFVVLLIHAAVLPFQFCVVVSHTWLALDWS
jgi:hypothetical protein